MGCACGVLWVYVDVLKCFIVLFSSFVLACMMYESIMCLLWCLLE